MGLEYNHPLQDCFDTIEQQPPAVALAAYQLILNGSFSYTQKFYFEEMGIWDGGVQRICKILQIPESNRSRSLFSPAISQKKLRQNLQAKVKQHQQKGVQAVLILDFTQEEIAVLKSLGEQVSINQFMSAPTQVQNLFLKLGAWKLVDNHLVDFDKLVSLCAENIERMRFFVKNYNHIVDNMNTNRLTFDDMIRQHRDNPADFESSFTGVSGLENRSGPAGP